MAAWLLAPEAASLEVPGGGVAVHAEEELGRIVLHVVLDVEAAATALCRMLGLGRGNTSRRQLTSMWVSEEISIMFDRGETSPALSRAAAFSVFFYLSPCCAGSFLDRLHRCHTTAGPVRWALGSTGEVYSVGETT